MLNILKENIKSLKTRFRILNYKLIEYQKKRRTSFVFGYPFWLTIDPTNICNLKCVFCPTGQRRGTRPSGIMTFKIFKKMVDILGPYLFHIDLCNWGEPFLNKEIYDIISYAKKYDLTIKVDTNFNVDFSEADAEKLVRSGLDRLIVSLDGASQETYEKYRREGNFSLVIKNVKTLAKKKRELNTRNPHIHWQFLVFRHNEHELEKAKSIYKEAGFDSIGFTAPFCSSEWAPANEQYNRYLVKEDHVEFKKVENICNWLWDGITINADGSISPCCSVEDKKDDFCASLKRPFFLTWNNKKYRTARKFVRDRIPPQKGNICTICDHIGASNHTDPLKK